MKKFLFPFAFFASFVANAQVGINTDQPKATLDIVASPSDTSKTDGFIAPRLKGSELKAKDSKYSTDQIGTIVYITEGLLVADTTTKTSNVTTIGYYYFDGTLWQKIGAGGAGADINIYKDNGTLTSNRTVAQVDKTLAFTSTATTGTNQFSVDGSTLSVDAVNNRIGLGTTTPQKTVHVNGALQVTNELNLGGNATTAGSAGISGQILASNGAGIAPIWTTLNTSSGTVSSANYVQGTTATTVTQGRTADVPGVTITLTVPVGKTQTFLFTILGYVALLDGVSSQGVMSLLQDGVKISSAFISKAGIFPTLSQPSMGSPGAVNTSVTVNIPSLNNNHTFPVQVPLPNYPTYGLTGLNSMPIPVTFLKSVQLSAGTYTFKVQYSAWSGSGTVNYVPSSYAGYNQDTECMLTKMQILVYNN